MKAKTTSHANRGLHRFLAAHGADVTGVISGYDRIRLRGRLRHLYQPSFMFRYLCEAGVKLRQFAGFVSGLTQRVCATTAAFAAAQGRPLRYLESCADSKEELARHLAARDKIDDGLVGVFSILEPCLTYQLRKDPVAHTASLHLGKGRCLHDYFYFQHPQWGLMHLRLQTWFPFQLMVCLNGRLWLARQLDQAGFPTCNATMRLAGSPTPSARKNSPTASCGSPGRSRSSHSWRSVIPWPARSASRSP